MPNLKTSLIIARSAVTILTLAALLQSIPVAADLHVLPQGAGTKDGSSWQNALDGARLQAAWDALKSGQTLWIGSGAYSGAKLNIGSGGEAGKLKTLAGKDTGGGAPVFTGTFKKDNPAKSGTTFITLSDGADFWQVQDIHLRDYGIGIASKAGGHVGARIRNFDVTGCREGISLHGGAAEANPELGSHDIEISDCEFTNYTKRGIRLKNGNYDFKITNVVADAGGKAWATEPFQMGFDVIGDDAAREKKTKGAPDHDITFTNCVALNNYHDNGEKYWNADGFVAERGVYNLRFINCKAFDNTDGGWDLKAENTLLEGCVALGNKRNYRFWGTTKMVRCLSAYSVYPGGSGGDLGLWTSGTVTVEQSSFYNSGISPEDGGKVVVTNSLVARSKERPGTAPLSAKDGVTLVETVLWDETAAQGENPQFVNPSATWEGQGDAFNSKKFGPAKGYFNTATAPALPFRRTLPLIPGTRGKTADAPAKTAAPVAATPKTAGQIALEAATLPVLENGGFEGDLTGWGKAAPSLQIKTQGAAQGQKYAAVTAEKRVAIARQISGLVPGRSYTLSFQSRGNTSKDARLILRAGANGKYLKFAAPSATPEWKTTTLKFAAPSAEVSLQISVREAGTFDLDDFVIKRAD